MNHTEQCQQLCQELGWSLDHYRITFWLERVGKRLQGKSYTWHSQIPQWVIAKLAQRLKLRLECQKLLDLLQWDWQHPEVKRIEAKYKTSNGLPLDGYLKLRHVLDEEWLINGGGF